MNFASKFASFYLLSTGPPPTAPQRGVVSAIYTLWLYTLYVCRNILRILPQNTSAGIFQRDARWPYAIFIVKQSMPHTFSNRPFLPSPHVCCSSRRWSVQLQLSECLAPRTELANNAADGRDCNLSISSVSTKGKKVISTPGRTKSMKEGTGQIVFVLCTPPPPTAINLGAWELGLQRLFELHVQSCTLSLDPANLPLPPHLGSYTRALLVSQDRRHLFVTPCLGVFLWRL